jgi:hypothetical protein
MVSAGVLLAACSLGTGEAAVSPDIVEAEPLSPAEVLISWTDAGTGEQNYLVERCTDPTEGFEQVAEVGADVTAVTDTTVDSDTHYYYRVGAVTADATLYGRTARVRTPPAPLTAPAVADVSPVAATSSGTLSIEVELSWTVPEPAPDEILVVRHHVEGAT